MLAQLRTHWRGLTADEFLRRLTGSSLPSEYSHAYLLAHTILGNVAFEVYPFLSSMALCTRMPPASFVTMCHALEARGFPVLPTESVGEYLALVNELHQRGEIALAGTSAEVINDLPKHPLYSPIVVRLNDLSAETSILDYMAAPHRVSPAIAEAVARPSVYNQNLEAKTAVHIPDNWRPDLDRESRHAEATTLVLLMSVAARLINA